MLQNIFSSSLITGPSKLEGLPLVELSSRVVWLSAVVLSVVVLSTIVLSAVVQSVVVLSAIGLSSIGLNAVGLSAVGLSAIVLSAVGLSTVGLNAVVLSAVVLSVVLLNVNVLSAMAPHSDEETKLCNLDPSLEARAIVSYLILFDFDDSLNLSCKDSLKKFESRKVELYERAFGKCSFISMKSLMATLVKMAVFGAYNTQWDDVIEPSEPTRDTFNKHFTVVSYSHRY
jgi:hypothetical protein